jgi:hypothetical protein
VNPLTLTLATARLTNLITKDEISLPIREKVYDWAELKDFSGPRSWVNYLVNCPQCASVWAGAIVLAGSHLPPARPLIRALALSQAALVGLGALERVER